MRAAVGDRVVIKGKTVGAGERHGVITEVRGKDGQPPYKVKYDDGHESIVFPGGDFVIEHVHATEA